MKQQYRESLAQIKEIGKGKPFAPYVKDVAYIEPERFKHIPDPFDALKNDMIRAKCINEAKILAGPFLPSGKRKIENKPTRAMLNEILTDLFKEINEDWPDATPTVMSTHEDLIVIYFNISDESILTALIPYMNVFANSNSK